MKLSEMTKDERSLLLFLETQAVDYGGLVDVRHMNENDCNIASDWNEQGFIIYERISFYSLKAVSTATRKPTHYVILSEEAFRLAHEERIARSVRMFNKRTWKKAGEEDE